MNEADHHGEGRIARFGEVEDAALCDKGDLFVVIELERSGGRSGLYH